MARLEDLTRGTLVRGIVPGEVVTVVDIEWHGNDAITLVYRGPNGRPGDQIVMRDEEPRLEVVEGGVAWNFDAEGEMFRLTSEARRINLAYLFDPLLAVHSSLIDPLPHQITAVYQEMLPRQPLRFLLADDPGAGKTIMAGLYMKELWMRGDLRRCLVICPGNLVEQWQDELYSKFHMPFEILTREKAEASRTGNWFLENNLTIARLDQVARNDDLLGRLQQTDWDLVVVDEAHKMSASFFAGEISFTKRYRLGQIVGGLTRHLLLMTATPHNGREEDFQLFLALLDADRFEGRFRDGVHSVNVDDMIRRLLKEQLLTFDGRPLFPERRAYTVSYELSDDEWRLYHAVTDYVREEFNRADALEADGRRGTVGFALTILQRRLASSPEAIYQSLRRRKERLEQRLREEQAMRRGGEAWLAWAQGLPSMSLDDLEDFDDLPEQEAVETEELVVDLASASRTIKELELEIQTLKRLEALAADVRAAGTDRKWEELSKLIQDNDEMFAPDGNRRKLVIFTEHRDTLNYLVNRLRTLLGRDEAVVTIHGSMAREERRINQELFTQDRDTLILVATDAAGEGINLQRAHLMVNYDLPWNPNRLEQRFGRIHRIGQTEVCHLWNLVANNTREGYVFDTLFRKLEQQREALGGKVFDVLGQVLFDGRPLRELLLEAVRYGDRPDVRQRLTQTVDHAFDYSQLAEIMQTRSLVQDVMNSAVVRQVREDMERAEARRLQPHYIRSFFLAAFPLLGGRIYEREPGRFEITRVPSALRERDRMIGTREPLLRRYERVAFEKQLLRVPGKPPAEFLAPGHPLLDTTIDVILQRYQDQLKRGAILVDPADEGEDPRLLVYLEHAIQDARERSDGNRYVISRQMQFVEIGSDGEVRNAGYAPYLDYEPLKEEDRQLVDHVIEDSWTRGEIESAARSHAIQHIVPAHLREVRERREDLIDRTWEAVKDRLTKEIAYWDHQGNQLRLQEEAGKKPRLNSSRAFARADDLRQRLRSREIELEQERQISALPPNIIGGAIVIPIGLLRRARGESPPETAVDAAARRRIEQLAMQAVIDAERERGYEPRDVSAENNGWDIESRDPSTGRLRFIEVKGRAAGADTVTVSRNEILASRNKGSAWELAIVYVDGEHPAAPMIVPGPLQVEPDFSLVSAAFDVKKLNPLPLNAAEGAHHRRAAG